MPRREYTKDELQNLLLRELSTKFEYSLYSDDGAIRPLHYLLDDSKFVGMSADNQKILAALLKKNKRSFIKAVLVTMKEVINHDGVDLDTLNPQHFWKPLFDTINPLNLGWKELELIKRAAPKDQLTEDLGNLAQLNVGPLINVLKQTGYSSHRRGGYRSGASDIRNKFQFQQHGIGSTSEILDIGVLKQGIKNLRKAFKDNEAAKGFAAYIGGTPVMFGITNSYELAGSSRESLVAYDLTKWKDIIDQMYAGQYRKPSTTTFKQEEPSRYDDRPDQPRKYAGTMMDTNQISSMFTIMQEISKQTGEPLTAKLVMGDRAAIEKHQQRYNAREIRNGAKDLRTRLAMYKNSKKPTVNSVKEFIAMSLRTPGAKVQFSGTTYHLKSSSYDKIDPTNLLKGIPFSVSYGSADPGVYDSLNITYKFDTETNQLLPIQASFTDRRGGKYAHQEEILDPKLYLIHSLKTRSLDDKAVVLPKLLTMIKDRKNAEAEKMINALDQLGTDWPEIAAIRKSINAMKQG